MLIGKLRWLPLVFCLLSVIAHGQEMKLEPSNAVEREIAGGESHTYKVSLTQGQFARFRLDQRAIDAALILTAPDGKPMVEMNLTRAGDEESLSLEAALSGDYGLTVRVGGLATLRGTYRLEAVVKAAATTRDKQRIAAESLMIESEKLVPEGGKAAPKIIDNMQQALRIWREQNEPSWEGWSLSRIGYAYSDMSQQEKAIEYLGQGLSVFQAAKNRSGEGESLLRLGVVYIRLTQYEKAFDQLQRALVINREIKSRAGEGRTLVMMGQVLVHRGQHEKAIEYFAPAVGINQEVQDGRQQAVVLFSLGNAYLGLSKFEKAIETFEQALLISQEIKNRLFEAAAFANLGASYANTYRTAKGNEYIEQALAIYREYKERGSELNMLINVGSNYSTLFQYEKAIPYLEEALALAREIKNRWQEGRALERLGIIYLNQREFEKAIEFIEPSIAIFREIKARSFEASALSALGATYYEVKQFEKAIFHQEQALTISRETNDPINVVSSLYHTARAENRRGDLARAQKLTEEAIKLAESLRAELGSTEFRSAYLASDSAQGSYRLYTEVLMRQHQAQPTKGFDALAVEAAERQRARSLLDLLSEANTDLRKGVDPILIERERALAKQLNDKARTQTRTPEQAAVLKLEISQLENDYERAQVAIRKASPRYAALTRPQPLKLGEIQGQLDADTLLLEYALGEERSYLWAISKDSIKSYELPKEAEITQSALSVQEMLTSRSTAKRGESALERQQRIKQAEAQLPSAAQALSQTLLAPVAAELGNKRLVIVADGALQYIPFAMLPEPISARVANSQSAIRNPQSPAPLIVNHEIVSLPSASALAIQRAELAGRQPAPKMLAVIADPVFDRSDVRFTTPGTVVNEKQQALTIASDDARSLEHLADTSDDKSGVTTRRLVIPRLPFTRQEATRLLALTPKTSSFQAMDFQANRETVLKGDLAQYRYVHFATHGLLDAERPGLSSLVLSMVDQQGKPQDGFLRANDIYNLKLPAELVVLSACQTGLGKEIKGEGLVGLTRGFMYAGAARVVVSLWSVNDKATADLMTRFYEKMLKQGERPAAALRAAQVEMWKQKQWQSPYYWAAFTIQGEWR
ncbi:MAG TPA: CHAT domain-containing protein [Blastocatellia bacterium]|nr:CHAT domain-containing protein [Blastocatellia bacterium]